MAGVSDINFVRNKKSSSSSPQKTKKIKTGKDKEKKIKRTEKKRTSNACFLNYAPNSCWKWDCVKDILHFAEKYMI